MCEVAENVKKDMEGGVLKKEKTEETRPIRFEESDLLFLFSQHQKRVTGGVCTFQGTERENYFT